MTFLEYVAERLMGPPVSQSGSRSTWLCPFHEEEHPSFCTLPPKPGYKDRFRCFSCGAWGDEYDLVKLFYDKENFCDRKDRLDHWRQDYEREDQLEPVGINHPGRGRVKPGSYLEYKFGVRYDPQVDEFEPATDEAIGRLLDDLVNPLMDCFPKVIEISKRTLEICAEFGVHPATLAGRCGFEIWSREREREHLAECDDPDCVAVCCRRARGLEPLTNEEIEASRTTYYRNRNGNGRL